MKIRRLAILVFALSACRHPVVSAPFLIMRPLTVPSPADAPCAELARDLRAHGLLILVRGVGMVIPPDETLIIQRDPPAAAGTVFPLFMLCAGHDDPLPVELRMCVDGEHTFAVVSPASLRAVADVASRSHGCRFYDTTLDYYYAPFILRRGSRALIAGDHD
jgi:hypothetical protein